MGRFANLVIGPAGVGKTTFIGEAYEQCIKQKRNIHCFNFDPGAESVSYPITFDIKELVSQDKIMEVTESGPNASLIQCFDYSLKSCTEWFSKEFENIGDEAYIWIDCPGQIELYTHLDLIKIFVELMQKMDYTISGVFMIDVTYVDQIEKFISGMFACLMSMIQFEIPWTSILNKMDLLEPKDKRYLRRKVKKLLENDLGFFIDQIEENCNPKFASLNKKLLATLNDEGLVQFLPMNMNNPDSLQMILDHIDSVTGYDQDRDPEEENYDPSQKHLEKDE